MAHKDWCGKPCAECKNPCALDESIPCSPDCTLLFPDGDRDYDRCAEIGCDAYLTEENADCFKAKGDELL